MCYVSIQVTSVLMFSDIRFSDAGRYRCVADNGKTPPATSNYAQIRVIRKSVHKHLALAVLFISPYFNPCMATSDVDSNPDYLCSD